MGKFFLLTLLLCSLLTQAQNLITHEKKDSITVATNVCKKFYTNYCNNILIFYKQQGNQILLTNDYPLIFRLSEELTNNAVKEETTTINNIEFISKINFGKLLFTLERQKSDTTPIKVEMVNGIPTPNFEQSIFNITKGNSITSGGYYLVYSKRLVILNGGIIFTYNNSQGKYMDNTECIFDGVKYVYKSNQWTKQ